MEQALLKLTSFAQSPENRSLWSSQGPLNAEAVKPAGSQPRDCVQLAKPTNELLVHPPSEYQDEETVDSMVVITFADEASTAYFG